MNAQSEKTIFLQALDHQSPEARSSFLDSACDGDISLRASIQALLDAHERPANPLDQPVVDAAMSVGDGEADTLSVEATEHLGMTIGPYRLMEQIGEGGFGLVFVAQQEQPVKRRVALKIIKPGTGSKEVIARFEAEQQAVAIMDHPNIAQVFDAGVTEDGRPYFVMELVRGVPITQFCDGHQFSIAQRLELFSDVCSAVQHAHQKGVIHRDLKPSNVLVTKHDDRPVVKVIDFGVAKAIGQTLTDKTIYTRFFSMIGTPLYMSPEQAEMSGLDIDTRSDIYSLGVMLYELMTGTTPFKRERLDSVGYDEMRRIIREEEPPRPSMRVTTLGERLSTISATRKSDPGRLTSTLRGDLDWIVMKSLEKDRTRRYESAAALASDVRRYLNEDVVEARPPSRVYLVRKFARRNRGALIAGSLIVAALLAGTAASLWQASNAIAERNAKDEALREAIAAKSEADEAKRQVEQFAERLTAANLLISGAQAHLDAGRWQAANDNFTDAVQIQPGYYLPYVQRAQMYVRLKLWREAADDYAQALELGASTNAPQWWGVPALLHWTGQDQAYRMLRHQLAARIKPTSHAWNDVRGILLDASPPDEITFQQLAQHCENWMEQLPVRGIRHDGAASVSEQSRQAQGRRGYSRGETREGNRLDHRPPIERRSSGRRPGPDRDYDHGYRRPPDRPRGPGAPPTDFKHLVWSSFTPREAKHYVAGWAYLRSGQTEPAIEHLQRAGEGRRWPGIDLIHSPLAMAYHQNGQSEQAEQELSKARNSIDRWLNRMVERPASPTLPPWIDIVEALVVFDETSRAITGRPAEVDERLRQIRDHAITQITVP